MLAFLAEGFLLVLRITIGKAVDLKVDDLIRKADDPDSYLDRAYDPTDDIEQKINNTQRAVQSANDKDDALIDGIRADLQGDEGRALGLLSPRKQIPK